MARAWGPAGCRRGKGAWLHGLGSRLCLRVLSSCYPRGPPLACAALTDDPLTRAPPPRAAQASSVLASLSRLNCRPGGEWLSALLLGTRRSLSAASAAQLTDTLSALAKLRFRPPEPWLSQYFTASFQRLAFHTPAQLCAAAAALARLLLPGATAPAAAAGAAAPAAGVRRPQRLWLDELGRQLGLKLPLMSAAQQAAALTSAVELGYQPSASWLATFEQVRRGAECLACMTSWLPSPACPSAWRPGRPTKLANELCTAPAALVAMTRAPRRTPFPGSRPQHSNPLLADCGADELCHLLPALARVGFRPQVRRRPLPSPSPPMATRPRRGCHAPRHG